MRRVISLHGILSAPAPAERAINSKILVLRGDADRVVPFDQLASFLDEMRSAKANWEINIYGNARRGGVLDQNRPQTGLHQQSESRSWRSTLKFLAEVLD